MDTRKEDPKTRVEHQEKFRQFSQEEIAVVAGTHDADEKISKELISKIARQGYLGATVSKAYGGMALDLFSFGLLNLEVGKCCTSVRSLITVQSMVTGVLERWGTEEQKDKWLARLASGDTIAAFALTEPEHGSDAAGIQTHVHESEDAYVVTGQKKWISFGQIADLFLVFGQVNGRLCCFLVEHDTPGLVVTSISGVLGVRGAMLAGLEFKNCAVPKTNRVGGVGFGLHPVGFTALDIGRYSIAWGCVGMAEACLDAAIQYVQSREQFGTALSEHQLVQALISDMMVDIQAARLLCEQAGRLKADNDPSAIRQMLMAKYYSANMAIRVTGKAVQLHGANGYSKDFFVERFFRDAKIMETIEGSHQMMQIMIAKYGFQK